MNIQTPPVIDGFDPLSQDFLSNPIPHIQNARTVSPVFFYPPLGMWVVTGYDNICQAARNTEVFSSKALGLVPPPADLAHRVPEKMEEQFIIAIDPPQHTESRMGLAPFFTPRKLVALEDDIRRIANELIDDFIEKGSCEFMHDFCYPLSLRVIMELLGIPQDRAADYRRWTDDIFQLFTPRSEDNVKPITEEERRARWSGVLDYNDFFDALLDERERNPQDDLVSKMLQAKDKDGNPAIPRMRLLRHIQELVAAGNDTTANLLAVMVQLLTDHPAQREDLAQNPELMANAVEEALRIRGTSPGLFRFTTRETALGGVTIPAHANVWLLFAAGGLDDDKFIDAARFDIRRENADQHLSFGHGRHACMGSPLARVEIKAAMEELLRRIPDIRVTPGQRLDYLPTLTVLALKHLTVEWTPAVTKTPEATKTKDSAWTPLTVIARKAETEDVISVTLADPDGATLPAWDAGAHVDLRLPSGLVRSYSLAGDPSDRTGHKLGILREAEGRGGSAECHAVLKPGATIEVSAPSNHFPLKPAPKYVFIAGGIGITPLLPMIRTLQQQGADWTLTYGARSTDTMAFLDEVQSYGDKVTLAPQDQVGLLDLDALLSATAEGAHVYACGPGAMLKALQEKCATLGCRDQLHIEHFSADGLVLPDFETEPTAFEVELSSTGQVLQVPANRSLRDVLLENGANVTFSCESGYCGTCETRVLGGTPEHHDVILTDEEKAEGRLMMVCVGRCAKAGGRLVLDI